jgi:diguanylate cyclase (GGDEF)-like protein
MNDVNNKGLGKPLRPSSLYSSVLVAISLAALVATYLLANSSYEMGTRTYGFLTIVGVFLVAAVLLHFSLSQKATGNGDPSKSTEIDRQLSALDDAYEFFAGSLKPADSFRLIASRAREMLPFRTLTLHLCESEGMRFIAAESDGPDAEHRRGRSSNFDDGIISRSCFSSVVEVDRATSSSRPTAAVPLKSGSDVFGILHLDFDMNYDVVDLDLHLLEAIGTRAAPLLLSSIHFEQSRTNAVTDPTTDLPNERAFYMVLENQVAESQRKGSTRPLTILALDVRSFEEINKRFGHSAGDRVLGFVAHLIKDNLRQMDFLARTSADEFVVVLPTASKEISHEVIARIQTGFFGRKLKVTELESVEIELNIGWAAFGTDGETPETLLRVARERKQQTKSLAPNKVLWFPTEFAS